MAGYLKKLRTEAERLTCLCNDSDQSVCPRPRDTDVCPFECGDVSVESWIDILKWEDEKAFYRGERERI